MIVFGKTALQTTVGEKCAQFRRFAVGGQPKSGVLTARTSENCAIENEAIVCGVGAEPYILDSTWEDIPMGVLPEVERLFPIVEKDGAGVHCVHVGAITTGGTAYIYDETAAAWVKLEAFGERVVPVSVIGGDRVMKTAFIGTTSVWFYTYGEEMKRVYIGDLTEAGCFFAGRLFVALKPFTIAYSAPYEPDNFSESLHEGGRIAFPAQAGEVVALLPLKGRVYIFYERGISVLETAGSARDFKLSHTGYRGGRILKGSVGVCGVGEEKAFFLAEDGVYAFDGRVAKRVCENIAILPKRGNQVCGQASFDGKYFLSFVDENGEKRGLVVHGESGEGYYAFAPIGVCEFGDKALCVFDGKVQALRLNGDLPKGQERVWRAENLAFGVCGEKLLKELTIEGEGEIFCTVGNGKKEKRFSLDLSTRRARLRVEMKGKEFSLRLVLQKGASVRGVAVKVQRLRRVK